MNKDWDNFFTRLQKDLDEELMKRLDPNYVEPILTEEEQIIKRLKYAKIDFEGKQNIVSWVDNETMKAYRMKDDNYFQNNSLIIPLVEIKEFVFIKWCNGFDV